MSTAPKTVLGIPRVEAPWLLYLCFLAFQPLFDPDSGIGDWLVIAASVAVFLPVYGFTHRVIGRRQFFRRAGVPGALIGVVAMLALGVLTTLFNSAGNVFIIYAAAAAGKLRPRDLALRWLGAVFVVLVVAFLASPVPLAYRFAAFTPAAVISPILGLSILYARERRESNARLRMAQDQVERLATIAERERIARDLHDLLGHTLSTITLKSELAARLVSRDPARAEREIRDVERLSRETLSEVRAAVSGYRKGGWEGELANAKLALEAAGVEFDYFTQPLHLRPDVEAVLATALREGVTNVIRHAGARRCQVTLVDDGALVFLTVTDDGVGPRAEREGGASGGTGLVAMRERVRALGGTVTVNPQTSGAKQGTRLEVSLPRQAAIAAPGVAARDAGAAADAALTAVAAANAAADATTDAAAAAPARPAKA